jgi:hypothetical protein
MAAEAGDRVENTVSNSNSIIVKACLPRRCLEAGCITPLFIHLLLSNECPCYSNKKLATSVTLNFGLKLEFQYRQWERLIKGDRIIANKNNRTWHTIIFMLEGGGGGTRVSLRQY